MNITKHAAEQAERKGWTLDDIADTARNPDITYPSGRYPGQERRIRTDLGLCVIVDHETIVTVYAHCVETPRRPDQEA